MIMRTLMRQLCVLLLLVPAAMGIELTLASRSAQVTEIDLGLVDSARFGVEIVLLLSWDGPACVSRGTCDASTHA